MSFVTLARKECGAQLGQPATGRRRHTCSSPCRQKAYRRRVSAPGTPPRIPEGFPRLTPETRDLLRLAIDRRRRELLVAPQAAAADLELFADERVEA